LSLFFTSTLAACPANVPHCKHPDQMILIANRTILAQANHPDTVFYTAPGYELVIDSTSLFYCPFGALQCGGNISYTFVSICNTSSIELAFVSFTCEPEDPNIKISLDSPIPSQYIDLNLDEQTPPLPDLGIVMFVSSVARTGGASLAQRDLDCQTDASTLFRGTYKALLAVNDSVGPLARFTAFSTTDPVVRPDGTIITNAESNLIQTDSATFVPLINAPNEHADGSPYTGFVYTGLTTNPNVADPGGLQTDPTHRCKGAFLTERTCSGYTCSLHECRVQSGTYGNPDSTTAYEFVGYDVCDTPLPVYCLRDIIPFECSQIE